jgi:hypothetical protein
VRECEKIIVLLISNVVEETETFGCFITPVLISDLGREILNRKSLIELSSLTCWKNLYIKL